MSAAARAEALPLSTGRLALRSPLVRYAADEKLVALVRRGRHDAFEVLVERYTPRLLAFCRNMLRSSEDAEDVLQEVFANAHRAMLGDDRAIVLKPWLYRIARNRCLNELRRRHADATESMDVFEAADASGPTASAERSERIREVVADVKRLPESQRAALLLREMEGLPYAHIADVLDTTVPSVKSLLVRARTGLAEAAEARALRCAEAQALHADSGADEAVRRTARRHLRECAACAA